VRQSLRETAAALQADGDVYRRLIEPRVAAWPNLADDLLGPLVHVPRHPLELARFAPAALRGATSVARRFTSEHARALFLGVSAHSSVQLDKPGTAGFGLLLLTLAHVTNWPFPRGGSQALADALAERLRSLGGEIDTGHEVRSLKDLPRSDVVVCDIAPSRLAELAGDMLPLRYRRRLQRWRYGPGVFKLDYALDGPIPWRSPEVGLAGTVHLGGRPEEIVAAERAPWEGRHADLPFVLLAQQSLFDDTRAPPGKQTAWAYCHVPHGSTVDMRPAIENQIERFAPGFRERILACSARTTAELERDNPNLVGGDISGGTNLLSQLAARRRHTTPLPWLYLCSASTAPGPGTHGMCGHLAARASLRRAYPPSEG